MAKQTKEDNIRSAVSLLITTNDPAQWESDGSPKLSAIQDLVGADVTAEDVAKAAPEGGFKFPGKEVEEVKTANALAVTPPPPPDPAANAADDAREDGLGDGRTEPAVVNVDTPEPAKVIKSHQAALAAIDPEMAELAKTVERAGERLKELQAKKDVHVTAIEQNTAKLSAADAVRRVQQQTQKNLNEQKQRTQLAATALKASGFQVHASPLDASYANRKRTPEQTANMAKHVHQKAAENLSRRMGTA